MLQNATSLSCFAKRNYQHTLLSPHHEVMAIGVETLGEHFSHPTLTFRPISDPRITMEQEFHFFAFNLKFKKWTCSPFEKQFLKCTFVYMYFAIDLKRMGLPHAFVTYSVYSQIFESIIPFYSPRIRQLVFVKMISDNE